MKNLNRKSVLIGFLIPVIGIIFMGAVNNVLSRYHTIQAQEVELVDGNGNTVFSLSDMLTADANESKESAVDYGPMISNLKSEINEVKNSLLSMTSSSASNDDFVSLGLFTKNMQSMEKKIQNLSMALDTAVKTLTTNKKTCSVGGADCSKNCSKNTAVKKPCGANCTKACCDGPKKQCGSNCTKPCCEKKQIQVSNNDDLKTEIAALRADLELLSGAFDSYTSADSDWNSKVAENMLAITSELERISDNQDMLMKILKKDIKKLKKK